MASGSNRLRKATQQSGKKVPDGFHTRAPEKEFRSGEQGRGKPNGYSGGKSRKAGSLRRYLKQVKMGI